ncbi:hypothetical protein FRB98_004868 [Tulasnella sp. 332]|nr:hypothetical protein FRB98_004868 [Tulasnella sp. 332]
MSSNANSTLDFLLSDQPGYSSTTRGPTQQQATIKSEQNPLDWLLNDADVLAPHPDAFELELESIAALGALDADFASLPSFNSVDTFNPGNFNLYTQYRGGNVAHSAYSGYGGAPSTITVSSESLSTYGSTYEPFESQLGEKAAAHTAQQQQSYLASQQAQLASLFPDIDLNFNAFNLAAHQSTGVSVNNSELNMLPRLNTTPDRKSNGDQNSARSRGSSSAYDSASPSYDANADFNAYLAGATGGAAASTYTNGGSQSNTVSGNAAPNVPHNGNSSLVSPVAPRNDNTSSDQDPRKKYACPNCPRSFARAFNLKTHMATHDPHRVKSFVCRHSGCGRSFSRKHDLGRHLVSIHQDSSVPTTDPSMASGASATGSSKGKTTSSAIGVGAAQTQRAKRNKWLSLQEAEAEWKQYSRSRGASSSKLVNDSSLRFQANATHPAHRYMPAPTKVNPLWPHYAAVAAIALALLAGTFRFFVLGCTLHAYKPQEVGGCLSSRKVIFAGDSVTRQLFFAFAHLSDPTLPSAPPDDEKKHSDHSITSPEANVTFEFLWDPYLNTTKVATLLETGNRESHDEPPALLVLGSGLWYLRYAKDSGGLAAWEATIETTVNAIHRAMPGLADRVIFLPVEEAVSAKLSPERAASIHAGDVDAMNSDLTHRLLSLTASPAGSFFGPSPLPIYPFAFPLALNKMLIETETRDGIHFSNSILFKQAALLMNFRCNEALPKKFPFDKTCCNSYPEIPFLQLVVLVSAITLGPLCYLLGPIIGEYHGMGCLEKAVADTLIPLLVARKPRAAELLPGSDYLIPMTIFGAIMGLNFMADRTYVWLKEQKQFDPWTFAGLCLISLVIGLGTTNKLEKDIGFLSRQQTDEWKGWMQIAILIYHYLGASKISGIYNPIRVLVASYLWMTGYGHFHFYYKKADYGFLRIAQVMVRLNMLTVVLAYVMDTDYLFYYFAPLVSFWFTVIYGTMVIGSQHNEKTTFIVTKLLASMGAVTYVFKSEWLINALFDVLHQFFAIRWEAREWIFRVSLDLWIVYVGMFVALLTIKVQEHHITESPRWPMMVKTAFGASVVGMMWFFWFELNQPSKFTYNLWHPYVSWVPVLSFIVLRNATPVLRSAYSKSFAFIGRCSLETFIMQYHFWLAGDTKGILMVLPLGTSWRTLNMIVSTVGFIYVCHHVAEATGWLTNWVCGTPRKRMLPQPVVASTPARTTNGSRPEENIPLMNSQQQGEKSEERSAEGGGVVVFDADAHTNGLSSAAPSSPWPSTDEGSPRMGVPGTQNRSSSRPPWLERLAERPTSPGPGWSPYLATRNRVFGAWSDASANTGVALGVKSVLILSTLWILNLLWPS